MASLFNGPIRPPLRTPEPAPVPQPAPAVTPRIDFISTYADYADVLEAPRDPPQVPATGPSQQTSIPAAVPATEIAPLGCSMSPALLNTEPRDLNGNVAFNSTVPLIASSETPPIQKVAQLPPSRRREPLTPQEIVKQYGVRSAREFLAGHKSKREANDLIDGIIPAGSICMLLGDSNLGKSPLAYLMGICVAAGVNCLGCKVRQGSVVYFDCENGSQNIAAWLENIPGGLGLPEAPTDFRLWSAHDSASWELTENNVSHIIRLCKPSLVIIDTLPSFLPKIEDDNKTVNDLFKLWRADIRATGCSILFVYHPKKEGHENKRPPLEDANLREWFQWTRGPKSLVTGVDIRLGVDAPIGAPSTWNGGPDGQEKVELILRGMSKGIGEVPARYLTRSYNDEGVPLIYRALTGVELLFDQQQISAFEKLGPTFSTKEAKHALGKGDSATAAFLSKLLSLRLTVQIRRGQWKKTEGGGERGG